MNKWTSTVAANAAVANSVATSQTPGGAGAITLVSTPVTFTGGTAQRITITSTSDISNRTFNIVGLGPDGRSLTVTGFTGPNNATVTTSVAFSSVSSVTISGAAAGAITVGNSATAESSMYVADINSNPFSIGAVMVKVSGSPTFSLDYTYDDVLSPTYNYGASTNTWITPTAFSAKTSTTDGALTSPVRAIRLSLTVAGTVTATILQTGGGWR